MIHPFSVLIHAEKFRIALKILFILIPFPLIGISSPMRWNIIKKRVAHGGIHRFPDLQSRIAVISPNHIHTVTEKKHLCRGMLVIFRAKQHTVGKMRFLSII